MKENISIPSRPKRNFVPENLTIDSWNKVKPLFENLFKRSINSKKELENWMKDRSELNSVMNEDLAWRYIKMNINTNDENLAKKFHFWIKEISPNLAPYSHKLNIKLIESPFLNELEHEKYNIYLRSIKKQIEIYREENIPLFTEMEAKQQEYGMISAKMTVEFDGKSLTMQQASLILKDTDREKRKTIYNLIQKRRLEDEEKLDNLYDELIILRQKIAKNAGYNNYRDYMFSAMGRFDYKPEDCFDFHNAISKKIVPIITSFEERRKKVLNYVNYRPWDTAVDVDGLKPLKPFNGGNELTDLTIKCFSKLRPYFGNCISIMKEMKHLDLESKEGKAPGGFMYPLHEIGVPFIYMNSVGSQRDLVTMVHEGGHAIHSFLCRNLELTEFKSTPSEVAELASMAMELLSMDYWDTFYKNENELKRAKLEQLEKALGTLPWVAAIDKFQHWIYTNKHTSKERKEKWLEIDSELGNQVINWDGQVSAQKIMWQRQLHLYEVPFYYIEYGMAQLGAIAVWRSYKKNGEEAIENYINALRLGYTKSIGEIYKTAGIKFDFSEEYVNELALFIKEELKKLH
ncbi:MAG: oligoendopeptidase F [Flavobacteriales bacterium]|nr:oligoendopeptidase F [Flavobacteriales bacterium]